MPSRTSKPRGGRRPAKADDRAVRLKVLPNEPARRQGIKPSRSGKWRAAVLITVQVLIIVHIVWWLYAGRTTTPVEPSEAMEFTKHGVINAGFIFFAVTLLSTLLLGRWFCGWGCHVVMLQDFCGWIMKKFGIRPKPFRSRLLIFVPLILAIYMFFWPAMYRWGVVPVMDWISPPENMPTRAERLPRWELSVQTTTEDFWRTFPGVMVAIPFLAICGFATVYFLGAKGFCTYGCPYGGLYREIDRFSPARIRVTEDCKQTGHCTAVCTSNVRVHDEVREYGMVVDPGCMKCLDCVSVCPNNALFYGFGKPAVTKGAPKKERPNLRYDLTWPEEIGLAVVFFGTFMATRGVYGLIPMLMAVGIAGVVTFLVWKLWRMVKHNNVNLHKFRMKYKGAWKRSGIVFASVSVLAVLFTLHSGLMRSAYALAGHYDDQVLVPITGVYFNPGFELNEQQRASAERATTLYTLVSSIAHGGIGLANTWQPDIDARRAWLYSARGEHERAEALFRRHIASGDVQTTFLRGLGLTLFAQGRVDEALGHYQKWLTKREDTNVLLDDLIQWCQRSRQFGPVMEITQARHEAFPENAHALRWLALLNMETQNVQRGVQLLAQLIELTPNDPRAHQIYAQALTFIGRANEAQQHQQRARELHQKQQQRTHDRPEPEYTSPVG